MSTTWQPTCEQTGEFRTEVLRFFREHGRDLPWRRTRDPYRILVAEIMLQQTQVSRVLPYYDSFLQRFPNAAVLARADSGDVLRTWQGLGYNRRALYLKRAVQDVENRYAGVFPPEPDELATLPGVGKYTARAVACFAFEVRVAVVETNVRRAIGWFAERAGAEPGAYSLDCLAEELLPAEGAWEWNQALIDFGAVRLTGQRAQRTSRPPAPPFEETNRFWRGRIVAALCATPANMSVTRLVRELPDEADEYRVRSLINSLSDEGLVVHDVETGQVRLP